MTTATKTEHKPVFKGAADLRRTSEHEAFALRAARCHDDLIEALEKVARSLGAEISYHRCSCPHPCDDYFVHPGPCGARRAETYRNIKVIADAAIAKASA